jgi:hypothetical protein
MKLFLTATALTALTIPVTAQWLDHPTPGIPRTADGKPNLTAPAPRTADAKPDFTGLWNGGAASRLPDPGVVQPWAQTLVREREENFLKDRPSYQCLPSGPENVGGWKRIVQTPTLMVILNEDLTYRQIFMDGRALETNPNPTWMGYSVGRWEGDTLVVDSFGFNDRTWLTRGLPHTEALRMRERYQRRDFGHLQIEVTFSDPRAYTKPWSFSVNMELAADTEMLEAVCEFRRDHWVGKVSDAQQSAVKVAPDVLATYVGVYSGQYQGRPRTVEVTLADGDLSVTIGVQRFPLVAQSDTLFVSAAGLAYEFVRGGTGMATYVVERHVSGAYTYERRR